MALYGPQGGTLWVGLSGPLISPYAYTEEEFVPIYAYKCPNGHRFDALMPLDKRNDPQVCQECGKVAERQLTSVPTTFKFADEKYKGHADPAYLAVLAFISLFFFWLAANGG